MLTDLFSSTLVLFNFLQLSTLFYFICFLDVVVTFAHKWKIYFTILFFFKLCTCSSVVYGVYKLLGDIVNM